MAAAGVEEVVVVVVVAAEAAVEDVPMVSFSLIDPEDWTGTYIPRNHPHREPRACKDRRRHQHRPSDQLHRYPNYYQSYPWQNLYRDRLVPLC